MKDAVEDARCVKVWGSRFQRSQYGVGPTLPLSTDLPQYLASTAVVLLDSSGKTLAQGKGSDILGHPLNAVIWLVNDLAKQGKRLKKGDLVSLGSFNPPLKPEAGQEITVSYPGVPGLQRATVRFESPDLHFATISRNHPMDALGA